MWYEVKVEETVMAVTTLSGSNFEILNQQQHAAFVESQTRHTELTFTVTFFLLTSNHHSTRNTEGSRWTQEGLHGVSCCLGVTQGSHGVFHGGPQCLTEGHTEGSHGVPHTQLPHKVSHGVSRCHTRVSRSVSRRATMSH